MARPSATGRRSFKYRARSAEEIKAAANDKGGMFDKYLPETISFYKAREGENHIRILPPAWEGANNFGFKIHIHYGVGPEEQSYLCLKAHDKGPCPVCAEINRAIKQGEDEYAQRLKPSTRIAAFLIDRKAEQEGVLCWSMPLGVSSDINTLSKDRSTGAVLNIDHPDEGYDVYFDKQGTGIHTKYKGTEVDRNPSTLTTDDNQYNAWLEFIETNCIPDVLIFYPYEHIAGKFDDSVPEPRTESGSERPSTRRGVEDTSRSRSELPYEDDADSSEDADSPWDGSDPDRDPAKNGGADARVAAITEADEKADAVAIRRPRRRRV